MTPKAVVKMRKHVTPTSDHVYVSNCLMASTVCVGSFSPSKVSASVMELNIKHPVIKHINIKYFVFLKFVTFKDIDFFFNEKSQIWR